MNKFEIIKNDIIQSLFDIKYDGNLTDIGNEIGIIISKYFNNDLGYEKEDFLRGLKHGFSITNKTHP